MNNNLLASLRSFIPSEKKDPLENFITEAFAWLLKNYTDFAIYWINSLLSKINENQIDANEKIEWSTRPYFDGVYPDMVCTYGNHALIFENKAWADLHENQLDNYFEYAKNNYDNFKVILITAHPSQHDQNPDIAICWYDIYEFISKWLIDKNEDLYNIFHDFLFLLENEDLGPSAPISHSSIISYYPAKGFTDNTLELIKRIHNLYENHYKKIISLPNFIFGPTNIKNYEAEWGRYGLQLLKKWTPGIFIGFLIDGEDHRTKSVLGDRSPDFSVIIEFEEKLHKDYPKNEIYLDLVKDLKRKITALNKGYDVYHHIDDDSISEYNYWHPLHIRKPMLELFRGTKTSSDQEAKFIEASSEILNIIVKSTFFIKLREYYK